MNIEAHLNWLSEQGISVRQDKSEIQWLCSRVQTIRCKSFLEIGSRFGGSLYLLAQACLPGSLVVSVDYEGGSWGSQGSGAQLKLVIEKLKEQGFGVVHIPGMSQDPAVINKTRQAVGDSLDFLFIDGDHRYEMAAADWENYGSMVRQGGITAFHDIFSDDRTLCSWGEIGVHRLWKTLKATHKTEEITLFPGIGVLYKGVAC